MKKKLLIFHQAVAPYRVDQFNAISQLFDLEVVFVFDNVWNHKFDQSKLLPQLRFKYSFLLKGPFYKGRVFRFGILKTIRQIKPDIVIGFEYSFTTQYLILLRKFRIIDQKIGSTIDDSLEICNHVQSRSRYFARKKTVKNLDFLVVLSKEVSQFYEDTFKLKEEQLVISPVLQDAERLRNNTDQLQKIAYENIDKFGLKDKKVLLFVGRFIIEKAVPRFIKSINKLLEKEEDLVLVLVGDGADIQNINFEIKETHLEKKVLLPGRFEGDQLYAWYLCASGFVLPSTFEPFGAVVNEALIFGLKVLCSKYAGSSYLVDSEKGLLFDPLNETETMEVTTQFLNLIEPVGKAILKDKPSLFVDDKENFTTQWKKIMYG